MGNQNRKIITFIAIQLVLFAGTVAVVSQLKKNVQQTTTFRAGTAEKQVSIALFPKEITVGAGENFSLTPIAVAQYKKPAYIQIALNFDKTAVKLTAVDDGQVNQNLEVLIPAEVDTANTTGELMLTYGVKDAAALPAESIQLSKLTFTRLGESASTISINSGNSQIVFLEGDEAELQTEGAAVKGKPAASAETVTPQPVISPALSPVPTALTKPTLPPVIPTEIIQPTSVPAPTATPEQTPIPTTSP